LKPPTSYYWVYYINHDSNEGGICFEHAKDLISIIHHAKLWVYWPAVKVSTFVPFCFALEITIIFFSLCLLATSAATIVSRNPFDNPGPPVPGQGIPANRISLKQSLNP
jgi:hypothetical protein